MSRVKRLYRVIAEYGDRTTVRDFQTPAAAKHRAEVMRAFVEGAPIKVTVIMSDPITFTTSLWTPLDTEATS